MRRIRRILVLLLFLGLLAAGIPLYLLKAPVPPIANDAVIEIPRGSSTLRVGEILEAEGLLRSPLLAYVYRAAHPGTKFQAGEYTFSKLTSAEAILARIAHGQIYSRELTIPEGSSIFDIARILGQEKLLDPAEFLKAAKDPALIRDLDPLAPSLEGYLFPSTYRLPKRLTARLFCERLTRQFRESWRSLNPTGASPHAIVTLASLVEKESAIPEERPLIAGLFANRLKAGIKLECDPTVIYAAQIEDRYRGTIYKSDLANPSSYNTYQHVGLPPGPIANPGLESLRAALRPAETDAVFFVAEPGGTGRHKFSKTLAEHNRAVEAYRHGNQR
jgi:UPF0755 protein